MSKVLLAGVLLAAATAATYHAGLRLNTTASMPVGLWKVSTAGDIGRGEIVTVCPPDNAAMRMAMRRGYLHAGRCPGGYEPLIKPIAAVGGDTVMVTPLGVAVDGRLIHDTKSMQHDAEGRPLDPVPIGTYRVQLNRVWLIAPENPRSFDSRYFGPVPVRDIIGVAKPVWVASR